MKTKLVVKDIALSDRNEELGSYQFVVTFEDHAKARLFFQRNPEWKLTGINRLLNVPCSICKKDYYCKCFEKHSDYIESQILSSELLATAMRAQSVI